MEYLLIFVTVYNLILTLFVVKSQNSVNKLREEFEGWKSVEPKKELTSTDYIPEHPTPPPTDKDWSKLAEQLDKHMNNISRAEMEEWLKKDDNKKLDNLNPDYKTY